MSVLTKVDPQDLEDKEGIILDNAIEVSIQRQNSTDPLFDSSKAATNESCDVDSSFDSGTKICSHAEGKFEAEDKASSFSHDVLEKTMEVGSPAIVKDAVDTAPQRPLFDRDTQYLDGLRGIAMIMVFNNHFISNTWSGVHPNTMAVGNADDLIRSQMGLAFFFMLSGRLNVTPYFRRIATGATISWTSLPETMFRRIMRLAGLSILGLLIQRTECAGGAFYPAQDATRILGADSLVYPAWCEISRNSGTQDVVTTWTSPGDIVTALLRLFTSFDTTTQNASTSMLWSLPVQLWGIMFVLMLMPVLAYMSSSRRFILYGILSVAFGYTYSFYLPFLFGLASADLKATGLIQRLQNKSRAAFVGVELVLVAAFLIFQCYRTYEWVLIDHWRLITYRDGAIGYSHDSSDYARSPTVALSAFFILLWLEMSTLFQWLVGNFFFKWLGKIAFSFYISQMSILYLLIPAIAVPFAEKGTLYWGGIFATWVACFATNVFVGWALDRWVDRKWALLAPWMIKTARERGTYGLAASGIENTLQFFLFTVPSAIVGIPRAIRAGFSASCAKARGLLSWRNPVPLVGLPPHPGHYGLSMEDMHSTLFTADTSDNEQALRTRRLLRAHSYLAPLHFAMIPGLALIWGFLNPWHKWATVDGITFSLLWRSLWIFSFPVCVVCWLGYAVPDITRSLSRQRKQPVHREYLHRLYIVSVTRGTNEEATRRSHAKLKRLEKYHPAVRVIVLTDEPNAYPDLDNVVCPKSHRSPLGLAKHKARALDFFRQHMRLTGYDFVLHMDEESVMDAESLRGCFDFIRYTSHHMGQGIITYNAHNYMRTAKGWAFGVADALRVGDDLGRFSLQTNVLNRPVFGIHGSFLMLSGDCENQVGWDYSSLVEDFEFSQAAWKKGFTVGRIHGVVREQSPESFRDFLKQRRRWFMGIKQISGKYPFPSFAVKLWTSGVFVLCATLVNFVFSPLLSGANTTPYWLYGISCFCFGAFEWLYLSGMIFSDLDWGWGWQSCWRYPAHVIATIILQPVMAVVEACAVIWALSSEVDQVGFEVVKK